MIIAIVIYSILIALCMYCAYHPDINNDFPSPLWQQIILFAVSLFIMFLIVCEVKHFCLNIGLVQ